MPEPGKRNTARWQLNGWSLRTKVAVVLLLPAAVALVLSGIRVQGQLDEASRLTTLRDQVSVLRETIDLTNLISNEMVAATPVVGGADLNAVRTAVDERAATVRQLAGTTGLPSDLTAILDKGLSQLGVLRVPATDPASATNRVTGYYDVVNTLSELSPGIIALAGAGDLERPARAVQYVLRLRGIIGIQEILLRFGSGNIPVDAGTGQRTAAEEALLSEQIRRDIPAADAEAFDQATQSATSRRDAYQAAFVGQAPIVPQALLPGIAEETRGLDALVAGLVDDLSDNVSGLTDQARSDALRDTAIVLGAVLAALVLALVVGRSLLVPVRLLRSAALGVAHHRLPETVERIRAGDQVDWRAVEPVPVRAGAELGQLAQAFDDLHRQAVRLAGEQAELRRQVSEMFTTLSRRSQSLVELQLEVIEDLESDEEDARRLEGLFKLDHLATRLRRNGENLQVLAGGTPARRGQASVTVVELLRGSVSEVNDYRRVRLGHAPNGSVRGSAAADIVHILAELLENATRFSPPERKVVLTADRGADGGLLIEVVDGGLGMAPEDLAAANARLAATDDVGPETTRRMGLFVVSRLAERHGVLVRLRPTYDTAQRAGITASVHVPANLVIAEGTPETFPAAEPAAAVGGPGDGAAAPADELPVRSWFVAMSEVDNDRVSAGVGVNGNGAAAPVNSMSRWMTPVERAWRAADTALSQQPTATTAAGLPMRRPGARVVPAGPEHEPVARGEFRDPESIRANLSQHYKGIRAARQHTQARAEEREGQ